MNRRLANGATIDIRPYASYQEEEMLRLYAAVGWSSYTKNPEALRKGYENSLLVLAAYRQDELLGVIRAVGDGHTIVFVQDILVFPAWQRQGIGTMLLQSVLERYLNVRQIELVTDNTDKTIAFYQSLGFTELSKLNCCGFMKVQ